jgi:hypothetical protein
MGRSMFLNPDLNIGSRVDASRTGTINFTDPFGILNPSLAPGEAPYVSVVRLVTNKYGYTDYDALNLSVEKRFANYWSLRGAYSLGYSRGVATTQGATPALQVGTDLKLDEFEAPTDVDRRHNLAISGRVEIPKTRGVMVTGMLRMLSGTPFTLHDTRIDPDQNGVLFDPLPAGTYSGTAPDSMQNVQYRGGRNGAYGPGFVQLDLRAGYRARLGARRTLDVFCDVFNVTNRANFVNPPVTTTGLPANTAWGWDRRNSADFLRLTSLVATSGLPRQAQLGVRLGF